MLNIKKYIKCFSLPSINFSNMNKFSQYRFLFIFSFLLATSFFLPYIIQDGGSFLFYGDYTVQQIPFYQEAHRAILHGDIFWNWNTDLGANFIGSYSFYLLGSPFFWLTLPFPNYLMVAILPWLLVLKFTLASVFCFAFIKRYVKNINFAFIGAVLYAFSGFSIYNIFFNHFHEMIVLFPLLLYALDELLENNRRGIFAVAVLLNALCNYYFFIAEVIFILIYFFVRILNGSWKKLDAKLMIALYFEAIIGVVCACVIIFPTYLSIIQIPRTGNKLSGWDMLFYGENHTYGNILAAFFLPPELPAKPMFFSNIGAKWSSMAAWLPLFSMTGAIAWLFRRKKDWVNRLILVLMFFLAVPILNSSFQLFSNNFYTRWLYMFVLIIALATALALDNCKEKELSRSFYWTIIATAVIAIPVGLIINPDTKKIGLIPPEYFDRYLVYLGIVVISFILTYILIKLVKRRNKKFFVYSIISLFIVISITANVFMLYGRSYGYEPTEFNRENINARDKIDLPNLDNVRSDVLDGMDNQAMFWQIPNIQAFHSIVPGSVTEFYESVGVERGVASRPEPSHIWLRSLLSVKYLFDPKNQEDIYTYGWKKLDKQNDFTIWENENYIPFGFIYSQYTTKEQFDIVEKSSHEKLLLNAILLNETQVNKYKDYLTKINDNGIGYFSDEDMSNACKDRNLNTVSNFKRDNFGFEGDIALENPNLVFFSIPFEQGWSATVNGNKVDVEKVNSGLMAVFCQAGQNKIRFNYMTPGLKEGLIVSIAGVLILILYIIFNVRKRKKAENIK